LSVIEYSSSIKTDKARLAAVYSILEQFRLERNSQGERALVDWNKNGGKYRTYSKIVREKMLPLQVEQDRLKEAIKAAYYSEKEWDALTLDEKDAFTDLRHGDRSQLKKLKIKAVSYLLDEIKAIDLDTLEIGEAPPDPTENFETYEEQDDSTWLTVTVPKIAGASVGRNDDAYVYKDFTASHFNAIDTLSEIQIQTGSLSGCLGGGPGFTNTVNDMTGLASTDMNVFLRMTFKIYLIRGSYSANDSTGELAADTTYYLRTQRTAASDTFTVEIYPTSSDRTNETNIVDTLTLSNFGTATRYQYCFGFNNYNDNAGGQTLNGFVQNVDLQEVAVGIPVQSFMHMLKLRRN